MEDSKALCGSSKFPWARARISSKFIDDLGRKVRQLKPWWGFTLVWLGYCVDQGIIIPVFEEHSGTVFPRREKMEAV
jgi:hypothetical protein